MLNRHIKAFGLPPILGYLLGTILFIGGSLYLFYKTAFAPYIYAFFAISTLSLLSETRRNDFLKTCFPNTIYWQIRLAENLICILPFLLFLVYKLEWLVAIGLIGVAFLIARFQFNNQLNYTIPSPFYHYPFEFTVGFRKAVLTCFFAYFLTYMSISVGNFNLGIFALLFLFLISYSFYSEPDSNYYVWIHAMKPKSFLLHKIKIALFYATLLSFPIGLSLGYFFRTNVNIILLLQFLGYLYLVTIILAKYTAFPKAMNLPQVLFIIGGVFFPPFLLFVLPFFYKKAIRQLNTVLS